MVIINDAVKSVLNRLLLSEVADKGTMKLALTISYNLKKLDKSVYSIFASSDNSLPYNWRKDNVLIYKYDRFVLCYTKSVVNNSTLIVVEEIAVRKGNGYDILTEKHNSYISKQQLYEKIMVAISGIIKENLKLIND